MRISPRLQLVFDNLLSGKDVWDFCCDHGYLAAAAYESQKFNDIYFVDQVSSIMERTERLFKDHIYSEENKSQAYFLQLSGETVTHNVTGTACIIGVGAHTIHDILDGLGRNNFLKADRLVLGPHRDVEKLLTMIANNQNLKDYSLAATKKITEDKRERIFYVFESTSL